MNNDNKHKFEVLKDPFTLIKVEIDIKIVPLISSLWNNNITTSMSCQNIDGQCWIVFPSKISFDLFINKVLSYTKINLTISRSGNFSYSNYHIRFDNKYIPKVTKLFK